MPNPLVRKLEQFVRMSHQDRHLLDAAARENRRYIAPRQDIISEGEQPTCVNLILSGWGCRYKMLEDGRRQIVAFFLPGDLCDLKIFILKQMDHSIAAISPVHLSQISRETILKLTEDQPRISRALWWSSLVSEATEREWIVSLGQRSATERLGHLFCELFVRLRGVEMTEGWSYELPLTQTELGEVTGLSTVHVNRTLQDLRRDGLIELKDKTLTILDFERLQAMSMFSANYLHLEHEGQDMDANEP
jgi:CRP-like cAMP-binding protein